MLTIYQFPWPPSSPLFTPPLSLHESKKKRMQGGKTSQEIPKHIHILWNFLMFAKIPTCLLHLGERRETQDSRWREPGWNWYALNIMTLFRAVPKWLKHPADPGQNLIHVRALEWWQYDCNALEYSSHSYDLFYNNSSTKTGEIEALTTWLMCFLHSAHSAPAGQYSHETALSNWFCALYQDLTCKRGSVGQSEGLCFPRSSFRFRLKPTSQIHMGLSCIHSQSRVLIYQWK